MKSYYPVFLDINNKRCVVIGGGAVALRKIQMLLECNAHVVFISPEACAELTDLVNKGRVDWLKKPYGDGDLEGAYLVIAATNDNMINDRAAREARKLKALINVVDKPALSDFIVPSTLECGDLKIAISTGGSSPALAKKIRIKLEEEFGTDYGTLAKLIAEVRDELISRGIRIDGDRWQEAIDLNALIGLIKKDEIDRARDLLLDNLKGHGTREQVI